MSVDDVARRRLGEAVARRRKHISLSVSAAARGAGIDRGTWTAVEAGSRQTEEYNFARIERVLGWESGSVKEILAGSEPRVAVPAAQASRQGNATKVDQRLEAVAADVKQVLDDPALSEDDRIELAGILMDEWERDEQAARRARLERARATVETWKRARSA